MSSIQQRLSTASDTRLAFVISAAVNLKAQLGELNELRDQLRKATIGPKIAATETAFGPE
jgi:hypothetical protein